MRLVTNSVLNMVKRTRVAKGCEVIIGGKVRGQRAKAQKYRWGYIITTGQPKLDFLDIAVRHVHMRQGVLGIKVKIFVDNQSKRPDGPKTLPDTIIIHEPKDGVFSFKNTEKGAINHSAN